MVVDDITENDCAGDPPKVTEVVPVKLDPVIVITESLIPFLELNEVMCGPLVLFLKTYMYPGLEKRPAAQMISGRPSLFKSPVQIPAGPPLLPNGKVFGSAKLNVFVILLFFIVLTALHALPLLKAKSAFPSPSRSSAANEKGCVSP